MDHIRLAELHPAEHAALTEAMADFPTEIVKQDGLDYALAIAPPMPRRGIMLIDPSYEVKADYDRIPKVMAQIAKKWNVGIIALWYPILIDVPHRQMITSLKELFPDILISEIRFPAARDGHRMVGSGMAFVNPPYGLDAEAARLTARFVR